MTAIMIMPRKKSLGVKKMRIIMKALMILALMMLKMIRKIMTSTRITIKDDNDKVFIMMTAVRAETTTIWIMPMTMMIFPTINMVLLTIYSS